MKPFIAMIGPPRIILGLVALGYGLLNVGFDAVLQGNFDASRQIQAVVAIVFAALNLGQEGIKAFLRQRFTIVEMDEEGLFDRRIMKAKLLWEDVEWIDPHPAGLPDRLRIMGRVDLTTSGKLRNFLIRTIRRLPPGEVVITFGGLHKAGAQATTWLADNKPGLVPDVWKSKMQDNVHPSATQHSTHLNSAGVYWREWIGAVVSGIVLVALVGALSPAIIASFPEIEKASDLPAIVLFIGALLVTMAAWVGAVGGLFWLYQRQGDRLIVISKAGFSDARISSQFIAWSDVESVTFEYRDMGRLINEHVPVYVQLREGFKLEKPAEKLFWPREFFRRVTTIETIAINHKGTTTSVSEIVETIQRHEIGVALREIARG